MSDKENSENLESTIRLSTSAISDPYANASDTAASTTDLDALLNSPEFTKHSNSPSEKTSENNPLQEDILDLSNFDQDIDNLTSKPLEATKQEAKKEAPLEAEKSLPKEQNTTTKQSSDSKQVSYKNTPHLDTQENESKLASEAASETKDDKPTVVLTEDMAIPHKEKSIKEPVKESVEKTAKEPVEKPSQHSNIQQEMPKNKHTTPLLLSLLALTAAFAGLWQIMSVQTKLESFSTQIEQSNLQTTAPQAASDQTAFADIQQQINDLKQQLASLEAAPKTAASSKTIVTPSMATPDVSITPQTPIQQSAPKAIKGAWNVIISSHSSMKKAQKELTIHPIKDVQTRIVAVMVNAHQWYRIVAEGFTNKAQALAFTKQLKKQGIADAWVQRNK